MKIELYRGGRPQGTWLDVKHMIVDLQNSRIMLEPGDHITVTDEKNQFAERLACNKRAAFHVIESHNG